MYGRSSSGYDTLGDSRRIDEDLVEEASAVRQRFHAKQLGERLPEVCKGRADSDIDVAPHACAHGEYRNVLT